MQIKCKSLLKDKYVQKISISKTYGFIFALLQINLFKHCNYRIAGIY